MIWRWEDTLWNDSLSATTVVEVLVVTFLTRHNQKIEAIERLLGRLFPVCVVEVIISPHVSLVNDLRYDVLLGQEVLRLRKLN